MVNISFLGKSMCVLVDGYCKCFCSHTYTTHIYINVRELKRPWGVLCGNVRYGTEKSNLWIRYFFGWLISESIKIN